MFVRPGYAASCVPEDVDSVSRALSSLATAREDTRRMGEQGRHRVLAEWNYEAQFQPVFERLSE